MKNPLFIGDEPKQPLSFNDGGPYVFTCAHQDLSVPVHVEPLRRSADYLDPQNLVPAITSFLHWWVTEVQPRTTSGVKLKDIRWDIPEQE